MALATSCVSISINLTWRRRRQRHLVFAATGDLEAIALPATGGLRTGSEIQQSTRIAGKSIDAQGLSVRRR
jgi:hypothetical protein